ncbi:unnamed protein product, partial [marine sediment metagenome]
RWIFSYETGSEVEVLMVFFYTYLLAVPVSVGTVPLSK